MRKIIFLSLLIVCLAVPAFAAFPVTEHFSGPTIVNTYEQFWTTDATLESVPGGTDGISDAPGGNGWIGRSTCEALGYASNGHVTGEYTDASYTLQAYVWTPVVNTVAEPDDYWYQQLIFYRITDVQSATNSGYGRLHTQFNEEASITGPRIRLQITNPGFVHTTQWLSPADFTHSEGWHKLKVEITGTTANCYFDDSLLGAADWTSDGPERNAGKFGFGQYIDGAGTRSLYIDNFKAWTTGSAEPADPTPTPLPLSAQNWTYYE